MVRWEDVIQGKDNTGVALRLEVHTTAVSEALSYLTMVPLSKEALVNKCEQWEVDLNSDRIPVAVLAWGSDDNINKNSIPTGLMIVERAEWKCGFGILGLVEQVLPLLK